MPVVELMPVGEIPYYLKFQIIIKMLMPAVELIF